MQRDFFGWRTHRLPCPARVVRWGHYGAPVLPMMSTGATDMAFLRAKGIRCFGIGPAIDQEDNAKGFGAHSDQERIVEAELYRFVRFYYDLVTELAAAD